MGVVRDRKLSRGEELPDNWFAPELDAFEQDLWSCFIIAGSSRSSGFSVSSIPLESVLSWLDLYGVRNPEVRRMYVEIITVVDREYLRLTSTKKASSNANPPRNS